MLNTLGKVGLRSDDTRTIVVFSQKGKTYRGRNDLKKRLLAYEIDGQLLSNSSGRKCDYGLGIPNENKIYFIELKGSSIKDAAEQIYATILILSNKIAGLKVFGRIVYSRVQVPDLNSTQLIKLKQEIKKRGGDIVKHEKTLEEKI